MKNNSPVGAFLSGRQGSKGAEAQVCIIGGGLAGLTTAIHLAKHEIEVILLEKHEYPRHKVCGEYISNEVLPYLKYLGIDVFKHQAKQISTLMLSHQNGTSIEQKLPLGGFGISRYAMDNLLAEMAKSSGVQIIFEEAKSIRFNDNDFVIETDKDTFVSDFVIASYGKRAVLDKTLDREFISNKTPWIGIKAHYKANHFNPEHVELHNFLGGYCGLSMVENGHINLCYLVHQEQFKLYKSIEDFNENGLSKNPYLSEFLKISEPIFEKHLAISQISFQDKPTVENHILYAGDAAGLIHPLCGNGMAMAIHSAKLVAEQIVDYYRNSSVREMVEVNYAKSWEDTFRKRLTYGKFIQKILLNQPLSSNLIKLVPRSSFLLKQIIKQTHGKPIHID
jgi:flavin-dependent dehydrogenase